MRIIGGTHKGKVIRPPQGLPVRPTTDLAKESLFNILNNRIDFEETKVLDLFAGTGNISLEFASRNAPSVLAVEQNFKCVNFISETAKSLNFTNLKVIRADAFAFIKKINSKFDLIFADPPYDLKLFEKIYEKVFLHDLLCDEGVLIIEHDRYVQFEKYEFFLEERKYGKVHFSFFQKSNNT